MANVRIETFIFMDLRIKREDITTRTLDEVNLSAVRRNQYFKRDKIDEKLTLRFAKNEDNFQNYNEIVKFIERQEKNVCLISNLSDTILNVGSISTVPNESPDTLILVHQNIQGMTKGKLTDIETFLDEYKVDIFCVTEHHWLKKDNQLLEFQNYHVGSSFRRSETTHGGSLIILRNNNGITFNEYKAIVDCSVEKTIEIACVESKELIVVCVYRRQIYDVFERVMDKVLKKIYLENKNVIVCGDFNINFFNNVQQCFRIKNMFKSYNLNYVFLEPTRIAKNKAATCIDNIFTNILPTSKHIIRELRSDHFGQLITFQKKDKKVNNNNRASNIYHCIDYFKEHRFTKKLRIQFPSVSYEYVPDKFYKTLLYMFHYEFISSKISGSLKYIETPNDEETSDTKSVKEDPQSFEVSSIHSFSIDSKIIESNFDISAALEHFFVDIPVLTTNCSNRALKYFKKRVYNNELSFKCVSYEDIVQTSVNLKDTLESISKGGFNIGSKIDANADKLAALYNKCIDRGVFPDLMKWEIEQSLINSTSDPPAVVLPIFILFETIILAQLQSHFKENELLKSMGQSNAKSSVRLIINNIFEAWVENHDALGIFWQFSKAGRWIDHKLLYEKLRLYGVEENARNLLISYYKHNEKLNVNGKKFDFILGLFLFRVYINDLADVINDNREIVLYADEISLLFKIKRRTQLSDEGNTTASTLLSNVVEWFDVNNLKFNTKNVKCIRFVTHSTVKTNVKISEEVVANTTSIVTFLDTKLHFKLLWNPHLTNLSNKFNFAICLIHKIRQLTKVKQETVIKIYYNLFHNVMAYSILLWGHEADDIQWIYKLQKRAVKEISDFDQEQASLKDNFKKLGILTVASQYIYENLIYVKKNIHLFRLNNHSYNTRNKDKLVVPDWRIEKIGKTFRCRSVVFYNKLPAKIKQLSFEKFRSHVKKILCENCYDTVKKYNEDKTAWIESE